MGQMIRCTQNTFSRFSSVVAVLLLLFFVGGAVAHEYWLEASDFTPDKGSEVEVRLSAGHYFPGSTFLLKDGVADGPVLTLPSGNRLQVSTIEDEKSRVGSIRIDSAGVYMITFSISRLYASAPHYEGKAILVTGEGEDDPALYASGTGLELVPGQPLSVLVRGDELPLSLYLDGSRVIGSLTILMENGKSRYVETDDGEDVILPLKAAGKYLVTASVRGRGCSLVFHVDDIEDEER